MTILRNWRWARPLTRDRSLLSRLTNLRLWNMSRRRLWLRSNWRHSSILSLEWASLLFWRVWHQIRLKHLGVVHNFLTGQGRSDVLWEDDRIARGFGDLSGLRRDRLDDSLRNATLRGAHILLGRQIFDKAKQAVCEAKKFLAYRRVPHIWSMFWYYFFYHGQNHWKLSGQNYLMPVKITVSTTKWTISDTKCCWSANRAHLEDYRIKLSGFVNILEMSKNDHILAFIGKNGKLQNPNVWHSTVYKL